MAAYLRAGSVITAPSTTYVVKNIVGEGTFGTVAVCKNTSSQTTVALKVIKNKKNAQGGQEERLMLQWLKKRGSEDHHIVRLLNAFHYRDTYCLEFERLDMSLCDYLEQVGPMSLMQIRPIIHQLATAFKFLKNHGIIHGDLKPENVMLVDHQTSFQVKLIDLGSAHPVAFVKRGDVMQTSIYRAPEVLLGTRYNEAIDMWSLGCIAMEMLTGKALFPGFSNYDMVRHIVKTVGTPPKHVLTQGKYTHRFFHNKNVRGSPVWKLKSYEKNSELNERSINNIKDLFRMDVVFQENLSLDRQLDWEYFVDLILQLLCPNPVARITPEDVLQHPFITMSHIEEAFQTEHVGRCVELMRLVPFRPENQQLTPEEEQLLPSSSNTDSATKTHNQQRALEEQTGADRYRSRKSLSKKNRKCEVKKKHLSNRGKVAFEESSSDSNSPSQDQSSHRPRIRRKGTPHPRVCEEHTTSGSSSGSRKRSRDPEETEGHSVGPCEEEQLLPPSSNEDQATKIHNQQQALEEQTGADSCSSNERSSKKNGKCEMKKKHLSEDSSDGNSPSSRSTEDQSTHRPCIRRKGTPHHRLGEEHTTSGSSSGSRKRSRDPEETEEHSVGPCEEEQLLPSSSNKDQATKIHNQQQALEEQTGAESFVSSESSSRKKRNSETRRENLPDRSKVAFMVDNSKQEEQCTHRPRIRKKGTPHPRDSEGQAKSSSCCSSRKRSREPEETEEHRLNLREKIRNKTLFCFRFRVGRTKSDQEEIRDPREEQTNSQIPEMRQDAPPVPAQPREVQVPAPNRQESTGSRKRSRDPEEAKTEEEGRGEQRCLERKRSRSTPGPHTAQ